MENYPRGPLILITNWLCSMMFTMVTLLFPFVIAQKYHESIAEKTMQIALGMYLLTIATTARNAAVFFFLMIYAIYLISSYGAYKNTDYFNFATEAYSFEGFVVITSTIVAGIEKWHRHVVKGEPFLPFSNH